MTYEEVAEQIYDEMQHNKITNYKEYRERLDKEDGSAVIENIMHNRWSFGFCDMCESVIFYDDDPWYDVQMAEPEEREILEETLPKYQNETANIIQDVCPTCWHKLLNKED